MKKVITAIGNVFLNQELNKKEEYQVLLKDIQYQEGVIETLNEYKELDLILISTDLLGEQNIEKFIENIFNIKPKIEIILFSNNIQNLDTKYLNSKQIYKIYENNKNGYIKFLENLDFYERESTQKITEDLHFLKNMIINNERNFQEKNKAKLKMKDTDSKDSSKIIIVSGNYGAGKSIFSCIFAQYLESLSFKVLLIDYNLEEKSLCTILGINRNNLQNNEIKKISKSIDIFESKYTQFSELEDRQEKELKNIINMKKEYYDFIIIDTSTNSILKKIFTSYNMKIVYLLEPNLIEIKKAKTHLEIFLEDWKIPSEKIYILFNKVNKYQIDDVILQNIFEKLNILGKIKYKEEYFLYINKCSNYPIYKDGFEDIYYKLNT